MPNKPEINLEVSAGFFRINAQDAIYNITVVNGSSYPAPTSSPVLPAAAPLDASTREPVDFVAPAGDNYYKQVSMEVFHDIGNLARSLSTTMMNIPMEDRKLRRADLDEAGEKIEDAKNQLQDIVEMTENATMEIMDSVEHIQSQTNDVRELLSFLKGHKAFAAPEDNGPAEETGGSHAAGLAGLREALVQARNLAAAGTGAGAGAEEPRAAAASEPEPGRYLFGVDTVLQTIYELCTNETVKGHISTVREGAEELMDQESFLAGMNQAVDGLEADDDNFFTLPLSGVLSVLTQSCNDKKMQNLFKKMDASQSEIFLDGNLPIEVPPRQEAANAPESGGEEEEQEAGENGSTVLAEIGGLLEQSLEMLDHLPPDLTDPNRSRMTLEDQAEIFTKIENAFHMVSDIVHDVQKITEALSFQDLSGQQIMKIIKLLSDFQVQLLAIVVSFGSQLKLKERNATLTPEESRKLAQDEVDTYLNKIGGPEEESGGVLDQDTVNRMLEEMGF